jgi:hypothetical protein
MNKDTFILTLVVLLMIAALAVTAIPTAKKLSDLLSSPVKKIRVTQTVKA